MLATQAVSARTKLLGKNRGDRVVPQIHEVVR